MLRGEIGVDGMGARGPRDTRETDRPDAYAPSDATAAAPATTTAAATPMAVPPGMGLGARHPGRAGAALSPGAALPHRQSDLDLDALALGNGRARGAKLRAHRTHGAGAADDRDRVRGWPFLQPSRYRLARAARAAGGRRRHQRGAGGLHHHPANRQESVPVAGAQFRAQSLGAAARAVDRSRAAQ